MIWGLVCQVEVRRIFHLLSMKIGRMITIPTARYSTGIFLSTICLGGSTKPLNSYPVVIRATPLFTCVLLARLSTISTTRASSRTTSTGLSFLLSSLDVGFVLGLGAGLATMTIRSTVPVDEQTDSATLVVIYMPLTAVQSA